MDAGAFPIQYRPCVRPVIKPVFYWINTQKNGILRNFDYHSLFFPGQPYDLIVYGDEIDDVQINLNDIRNQVPVELGLSKLASQNGLEFMNMASFNEQMRQSLKTSIVLNLFSALILLSILVVILQLSKLTAKAENSHYLDLLKQIGVPKGPPASHPYSGG